MVPQSIDRITLIENGVPSLSGLADALISLGVETAHETGKSVSGVEFGEFPAIIISVASATAGRASRLVDLNSAEWMECADDPQFHLLTMLQELRTALDGRPCKVVIIGPTAGVTGATGHCALATAAEGQRGLMKSIARQWAPQIRFAWLSVWTPLLFPEISAGALPEQCELGDYVPSLGDRPDWTGVARTAIGLFNAADAVTGQTSIIDGGEWMLP